MQHKAGMPCLKLNNVGRKSKHCGSFEYVAKEALRIMMSYTRNMLIRDRKRIL